MFQRLVRSHRRRTVAAFAVAWGGAWAVASGCRPEEPVPFVEEAGIGQVLLEARCRVELECECPGNDFSDQDGCAQALGQRVADYVSVAQLAELEYDGVCVGRQLERIEERGCAPASALEDDPLGCVESCKPYFGPRGEGDPCAKLGITVDVDDCAQGLRCVDAECVPMCEQSVPAGREAICRAGIVEIADCDAGLYCDVDGRCTDARLVGEPCGAVPCVGTAFCDLEQKPDRCAERLTEGSACRADGECVGGHCADGGCVRVLPLACEP